ncbi:MAG: TetR/AcrR family transcriptional regulator [Bacteriovoracaceae bacterium]
MKQTKGQMTQERIVKSAISLISKLGIEKTTFAEIAVMAEIKAPAILNYFKTKDEIIMGCLNYVLRSNQAYFAQELRMQDSAVKDLMAYARANVKWALDNQDQAQLIIDLYSRSLFDQQFREINLKIVLGAREKIKTILLYIKREKPEVFEHKEIDLYTRLIHDFITGAILTTIVSKESKKATELKEFEERFHLFIQVLLK